MEFVEVIKRREKMCNHYDTCTKCPLFNARNENNDTCDNYVSRHPEEAEKLIMAWEKPIDWDIVPVDTKILVRDNIYEEWHKRHFAEYRNGTVYAWNNGRTSWTDEEFRSKFSWNFAKLAE